MRKRLVSILMALCMAVSLLPVQALAADDHHFHGTSILQPRQTGH